MPTNAPSANQVHQSWLQILIQILQLSAAVAPAAAAPFVSPTTEAEIVAESQVVGTVAAAEQQANASGA
jgi:hypothetical protein